MEKWSDFEIRLIKKFPMLQYFTDRPFGVEIEFYGLDYYIMPPDNGIIKLYNIHSKSKGGKDFQQLLKDYNVPFGSDKSSWHLEEDSSIMHRGGVELISPILYGPKGLSELYRYLQLLGVINGVQIDESCGFHVHHGVDPERYTCAHLKELVRFIHPIEDYLYLLIPGNRDHKDTCRPMELDVEALTQMRECQEECQNNGCQLKRLWYSPENRFDPHGNRPEKYDKTRYHGLNLHSYWYRSTIEFRYHSAVLHNIDEAMQWIIFTQFLVELSQGNIRQIVYNNHSNKWMKTICKIYLAFGYKDRIKMT